MTIINKNRGCIYLVATSKTVMIFLNFIADVYMHTRSLYMKFHEELNTNMDFMVNMSVNRVCV